LAITKSQAWDKRCQLQDAVISYADINKLYEDNPSYTIQCSFSESVHVPIFFRIFLDDGLSQVMACTTLRISGNEQEFSAVASTTLSSVSWDYKFNLWKGVINGERIRSFLSQLKNKYNIEWDSEGSLVIVYINDSDWHITIPNSNGSVDIIYNSENEDFYITDNYKIVEKWIRGE